MKKENSSLRSCRRLLITCKDKIKERKKMSLYNILQLWKQEEKIQYCKKLQFIEYVTLGYLYVENYHNNWNK